MIGRRPATSTSMISSTQADFPLQTLGSFTDYLWRGGSISGLRAYLIRVEAALRPRSADMDGSSVRDLATLLIREISHEGVAQLEARIRRAADVHSVAEASWFELVEGFGRRAAITFQRMHDASQLLVGSRSASSTLTAWAESGSQRWRMSTGARERSQLLDRADCRVASLESALRERCRSQRADGILGALEQLNQVEADMVALRAALPSLVSSPRTTRHASGRAGPGRVRVGHLAEFQCALLEAEGAWRDGCEVSSLASELIARNAEMEECRRAMSDFTGVPDELLNWLERGDPFHLGLRDKAGQRRFARSL